MSVLFLKPTIEQEHGEGRKGINKNKIKENKRKKKQEREGKNGKRQRN
jgi:hypothetical protein